MNVAGADQGYRSLDAFGNWCAAGTAAAVGLGIANLEKLRGLVEVSDVRHGLPWLGAAFMLLLAAKLLGSLLATMAGSLKTAFSVQDQMAKGGGMPSEADFQAAVQRGKPWPLRLLPNADMRDPSRLGRRALWFLMISSSCTLSAIALIIAFWFRVLGNL